MKNFTKEEVEMLKGKGWEYDDELDNIFRDNDYMEQTADHMYDGQYRLITTYFENDDAEGEDMVEFFKGLDDFITYPLEDWE